MYNTLDSCYKKAIELAGVKAAINNIDTKVLIKNENAEYGIDYKKIISSTSFKQGDYVLVDGVQYLIIDIDEQMSQSIYNVGIFRKTSHILLGSNYKPIEAIVDRDKISLISSGEIQGVYDQYTFIIPQLDNRVSINTEIVWDGGIYIVISINATKEGLYYITGKYKDLYNPHTYSITLNSNADSINETATYQLIVICKDNDITQTNPTIIWKSSDETIATVNNGIITGIKAGSAIITATYINASATFNLTVNIKPSVPVISYTTTWSNNNGSLLKLMSSTTVNVVKTVDSVQDTSLIVNYTGDSTFNSLMSAKKISITKNSNTSYTIKNTNTTTTMAIVITLTDSNSGTTIETKLIKLQGV